MSVESSHIYTLPLAARFRESEESNAHLLREILYNLPVAAFIIGPEGCVRASNLTANHWGVVQFGLPEGMTGAPYPELLRQLPLDELTRRKLVADIRDMISGTLANVDERCHTTRCSTELLEVRSNRLSTPDALFLLTLSNTVKTRPARPSQRRQQIMLMQAEEEERRRIARELHDDTFQQLALIRMFLDTVRRARNSDEIEHACTGIDTALNETQFQIRTLSYVLHPPEIGSAGIVDALATFVKGFARRTGLIADFQYVGSRCKCSKDLEIAIYRVAQEALINVFKHASASNVHVRLLREADSMLLEIEDNGVGIRREIANGSQPELLGVGLAGMRERVEALAGKLIVQRQAVGTLVRAQLPRLHRSDC